jgi:hypothetical protein
MNHLDALPPELISHICTLVAPEDVGTLYSTGSSKVRLEIVRGLQTFSGTISTFNNLLHLVRHLERLVVVDVYLTGPYVAAHAQLISHATKSCLRVLKLSSCDCNALMNTWFESLAYKIELTSTDAGLSELLPQLQELSLTQTYTVQFDTGSQLSSDFLRSLPASMTRLTLDRVSFDMRIVVDNLAFRLIHCELRPVQSHPADLISRLFQNLPRECVHLCYYYPGRLLNIDSSSYKDLPTSLLHFAVSSSMSLREIALLPTCLETLELGRIVFEASDHWNEAKPLPAIRHLRVGSGPLDSLLEARSTAWNSLECLICCSSYPSNQFQQLPCHLKRLNMAVRLFVPDCFSRLPRTLTDLEIRSKHQASLKDVEAFPPCLTKLYMHITTSWTDAHIAALPRSLEHISLPSCLKATDSCLEILPPKLRRFRLESKFTSNILRLKFPPWLTKLRFRTLTLLGDCPYDEENILQAFPFRTVCLVHKPRRMQGE